MRGYKQVLYGLEKCVISSAKFQWKINIIIIIIKMFCLFLQFSSFLSFSSLVLKLLEHFENCLHFSTHFLYKELKQTQWGLRFIFTILKPYWTANDQGPQPGFNIFQYIFPECHRALRFDQLHCFVCAFNQCLSYKFWYWKTATAGKSSDTSMILSLFVFFPDQRGISFATHYW